MLIWLVFAIYAIMSATGLFLIKTGADSTRFAIQNGLIDAQFSPRLLLGFVLYVASFLLSIYLMSRLKLSLFYPIATGAILIFTSLFGYFFLQEQVGIPQMLGMALILAGIIVLNIR